MDLLHQLFSLACGQEPGHTWAPGGALLPFCQRCTGLYAGTALALALHLILRPRRTALYLRIHGLFLLQMAPFGFHLVSQGPLLRTVTGGLFAFGVVAFLLLVPRSHFRPSPVLPGPGLLSYLGAMGLCLMGIVLLAGGGGAPGRGALVFIATAGWVALAGLVLLDLLLIPALILGLTRPRGLAAP